MLNLVTGYRGKAHITADEEAVKNLMTFTDFHVSENGDQLGYNLASNNHFRILSGDLLVQGRLVRVENYEEVTLETGTQEMHRIDLVCLRYEKDGSTGIESVSMVAIKGAESATAAEVPAHNEGIIADGDTPVDFPLYTVAIDGLNVTKVTPLFKPTKAVHERFNATVKEVENIAAELQADVAATTAELRSELNAKAPAYTYGTADMTAGTTALATGTLYFRYE